MYTSFGPVIGIDKKYSLARFFLAFIVSLIFEAIKYYKRKVVGDLSVVTRNENRISKLYAWFSLVDLEQAWFLKHCKLIVILGVFSYFFPKYFALNWIGTWPVAYRLGSLIFWSYFTLKRDLLCKVRNIMRLWVDNFIEWNWIKWSLKKPIA